MDRLSQLRGGASGSQDSSLDGSSPGDSFMTANDTPSKYYSLSEDDSFDIAKDVSLATTSSGNTLNDADCFSNLSPIRKNDLLDYKIGKQIEAANILSGGVNIFDDNENSYDGNELVIDDNVEIGDNPTLKSPEKLAFQDDNVDKSSKLPDSSDLHDENVEPGGSSTLKSSGSATLVQNDTVEGGEKSPTLKSPEASEPDQIDESVDESPELPVEAEELVGADAPLEEPQVGENGHIPLDNGEQVVDNNVVEENENRTEVVLQIDGNNVDAINIGTGLYLYRKEGQEELAAVQIVEDEEPSFKFLKVRENAEGNLEVYEEIQEVVVVTQETPAREVRPPAPCAPRENNRPVNQPSASRPVENKKNVPDKKEAIPTTSKQHNDQGQGPSREPQGKMVKFSESRKSPLMAYHSTPKKEGIPLTKTMVDQKLHPNRHSDNIKKTIEVHTDNSKQKTLETPTKSKDMAGPSRMSEEPQPGKSSDPDCSGVKHISIVRKEIVPEVIEKKTDEVAGCSKDQTSDKVEVPKAECTDVVKASTSKEAETMEKPLIVSEEETKCTGSSKESESACVIPGTSDSIIDVNNVNRIEDKPLNAMTTNKECVKEQPIPTQSSVEAPIQIDNLEIKLPEKKEEFKENLVVLPIEVIESDMDEDALVIEEQVIDSQHEICEPENNTLESDASSVELPLKKDDNLTKDQHLGSGDAKPSISVETKLSNLETPDTNKPSKWDTTTANCNMNIITNEKLVTENKSEDKVNTQNSLSKNEVKCTNPKDTQLSHNVKIVENTESKESLSSKENPCVPPKENLTQTLEKPKAQETLVENKSNTIASTTSTAKAINELQLKPGSIASKLEVTDKKQEKKEELNVSNTKDVKTPSLLPIKQQQQPTTLPKNTQSVAKPPVKSDFKPLIVNATETKIEINHKPIQNAIDTKPKSINNNHAPVPFGKWTEANRQDFLNKIKESKVPVNMSNANQLKQPNDLNRRDVLKKIDSQRQTYNANVKIQESLQKGNVKTETAFASKIAPATVTKRETKVTLKPEAPIVKPKPLVLKKPAQEPIQPVPQETTVAATVSSTTKNEPQRKEINNQDLIDKTIEGIINRAVTGKSSEDVNQADKSVTEKPDKKPEPKTNSQPTLLDAIEMKMNELHGIPFVERPPHELPLPYFVESKVSPKDDPQNISQKVSKIPNLLPLTKSQQKLKDCEDDIINLETPKDKSAKPINVPKMGEKSLAKSVPNNEPNNASKDKIITEKDFDKFARRNSVTYENCLTVTDSHQVIQTVVPREVPPKKISRNEQMLAEAKAKSPHKHLPLKQYHPSKAANKYIPAIDNQTKQYQSKLQLAYQTAITAKRRIDSPITIIEDKPVKVVYLDSNVSEFATGQLNVQGRDLSPAKRPEPDAVTVGTTDSLDSDILDAMEEVRTTDDTKTKTKHQRKQVLTPVETPDLELIEPGDLGIDVSPKKKRKTEDKAERSPKTLVPKKSYLLGRSPVRPLAEPATATKISPDVIVPSVSTAVPTVHNNAVSAIDNLVMAAELLENQSEAMNASNASVGSVDSAQGTPVKRGRGRPRKNPLPDNQSVQVSPPKKPRLIDAKTKHISSSEDESSDDDSMIKENWTMGKINEKIVCPICNKLFRSENVVFKHVKHCAGPSPSRSDQDKRSPRRGRLSQESETCSRDSEVKSRNSSKDEPEDDLPLVRKTPKKRKSKDSGKSSTTDEVTPIEPKEPDDEPKKNEPRKIIKPRINPRANNLVCEICGKSFRQLSYLVSHKLQHKKEDAKKLVETSDKSVFSCETCKKEFRKLHHLVQHRLIHNPVQSRPSRKTSSEQKELLKSQDDSKTEDQSAGFRCEPCDKSFRKLHHLVEHRETHDGINRQRSNSLTQVIPEKDKPTPPPQCEICKKTFRKLHHLIEHKEQHLETSSEKSDDQKSVKSSLSTKDIIHECNLCYMVFPNEHSLNKHAINCLRKKKQSAAKQASPPEEKPAEDATKAESPEEIKMDVVKEQPPVQIVEEKINKPPEKPIEPPAKVEVARPKADPPKPVVVKTAKPEVAKTAKPEVVKTAKPEVVKTAKPEVIKTVNKVEKQNEPKPTVEKKAVPEIPTPKAVSKLVEAAKIKHVDEIIVIEDTPKKKVASKDKVASTVTKRQKVMVPQAVEERTAPASSDEDEIRYMINPAFVEDTVESKTFMKVRAKKRSSLQIERPNSKDLVRRRSLLQHPPKIPRLRAKSDDVTTNPAPRPVIKPKVEKVEVPSTDSDDSDVKYSFPKTIPEKAPVVKQEPVAEMEKKRRKTMVEKRKSLSGIAKRKSLGKAIAKPAAKPSPAKPIKRRTMAAEHRCDCGALFSSAALLARHASLAHTPPRVRRRRDPEPEPAPQPNRKSRTESADKPTRKSTVKDSARKSQDSARKTQDSARKTQDSARKTQDSARKNQDTVKKTPKSRNRVHGGVPLPEKRVPRK